MTSFESIRAHEKYLARQRTFGLLIFCTLILGLLGFFAAFYPWQSTYTLEEYQKYKAYCDSQGLRLALPYSNRKPSCADGLIMIEIPKETK